MAPQLRVQHTHQWRNTLKYKNQRPIVFRDEQQEAHYNALTREPFAKRVVKELAPCYDTLVAYKINNTVITSFHDIGINSLRILARARYADVAHEFISSFSLIYDSNGEEIEGWSYRIQNRECSISRHSVYKELDLNQNGEPMGDFDEDLRESFWSEISPSALRYVSAIVTPHWRYIHALIAKSFFPRSDYSSRVDLVTNEELDFMLAMRQEVTIDFFSFLSRKFLEYKTMNEEVYALIGCASIITVIAEVEKVKFPIEKEHLRVLDKFTMRHMGLVNPNNFKWSQNFRTLRDGKRTHKEVESRKVQLGGETSLDSNH